MAHKYLDIFRDEEDFTGSVVTDDYFETMRIPMRSGRAFTGTDRSDGPGVMLINERLARRLFPGQNSVGERLVVDFGKPFRGEIVGVVSDVRIYGQTNEVPDQMYLSIRQPGAGFSATRMRLVARVQGHPTAITPQVRAVHSTRRRERGKSSLEAVGRAVAASGADGGRAARAPGTS